ncbi:MAG: hypothetical protein JNM93_09265 [Bacteriovoracaceae bacterium]|nr:hypothetical protein [Bacteriovoracaceae bacterium]
MKLVFIFYLSINFSLACDHFFKLPSAIKWDKRIDEFCPVTHQYKLSSCWANVSAELYTNYFRRVGLLKVDEYLAYGYYYGQLMKAKVSGLHVARGDEFGGTLIDFESLLEKYGIVTQKDYQNVLTDGSELNFKREMEHETFMRELNTTHEKAAVVENFFGLSHVIGRPVDLRLMPRFVYYHNIVSNELAADSFKAEERTYEMLRKHIDAGIPIYTSWKMSETLDKTMNTFANVGISFPWVKADATNLHAMLIVGYQLDDKGAVKNLLIKNSRGRKYGENGFTVMSQRAIAKYLNGLYFLDVNNSF